MKCCEEGKKITTEIGELLPGATYEQKILIKGILIGANATEKAQRDKDAKKAG